MILGKHLIIGKNNPLDYFPGAKRHIKRATKKKARQQAKRETTREMRNH